MKWYLEVLRKYAVFSGRAGRQEYWMFFVVNLAIMFALGLLEGVLGLASATDESLLALVYSLAVLLPSLGAAVRRLHDTGRSGWWLLMVFIPIIGIVALLLFLAREGQPGDNPYGTALSQG